MITIGTTREWANLLSLQINTVRKWARKGILVPAGVRKTQYGNRKLYSYPEFEKQWKQN